MAAALAPFSLTKHSKKNRAPAGGSAAEKEAANRRCNRVRVLEDAKLNSSRVLGRMIDRPVVRKEASHSLHNWRRLSLCRTGLGLDVM
jgi:hypothetical protein